MFRQVVDAHSVVLITANETINKIEISVGEYTAYYTTESQANICKFLAGGNV